jgi:arylsulfatase A-like enzyme
LKLIIAHGLNVHWLGPYGNPWVETPFLDALATGSVVFDQHFAGRPDSAGWDALLGRIRNVVSPESIVEYRGLIPPWTIDDESFLQYAETADGFTEEAGNVEEPEPMPIPGDTFDPRRWNDLRFTFAAALSLFDRWLEETVATIPDDEPVVVTSSFGQELGEHGRLGQAADWLYEETIHIPLIVRLPQRHHALHRIGDFSDSENLPDFLADLATGTVNFAALTVPRVFCVSGSRITVRTPDRAFLTGPAAPDKPQLYRKPDDLWEVNDIAQHEPGAVDDGLAMLREFGQSSKRS